ncbi:heparan-alpha-glucosaminide N-acetyltransferase-like [Rhynchophorus ferrugineus]|uniref:heparan-alpha-glucosaminide N-acetyltransferase-like n=1 Tax=Rhynchophorus ferrugineus TaxID=354439 RepID=UPI003FCEDB7C
MTWDFIDDYSGERFVESDGRYFDMDQLKLDQHFLAINNSSTTIKNPVYLYTLNHDCVQCPYTFLDQSKVDIMETNMKYRLATRHMEYFPADQKDGVICDLDPHFGQFGVYNIKVNNASSCSVETIKEPVNIYSPILTVFILHVVIFGFLYLLISLWDKWKKKKDCEIDGDKTKTPKKERVMSIDAFRGISIVIMIFANFGNGGYHFVHHAIWNGLHVADLVFPWFMWIMGTCIPISLSSSFKRNVPNKELIWTVAKRSIKLFLIGIFLNSGCDVYYIRIFGVLQRFGLCYFIVTTLCILTMDREFTVRSSNTVLRIFDDILKIWKGWLICTLILIVHTILVFTVAAPGCPRGYMGPGGLHMNRKYETCIGGATGYIDGLILGNHVYQKPTIYNVFEAKPFDPEGVVGCLTTIFHVMLGVQAGVTLMVIKNHYQRILRWLVWSLALGVIGGGLCGFSKEDGLIPVNKNLWSMSFVFVTCSFAFLLLSACYFLIDVKKWWTGKPVLFAGMNAIILYIGHEMTDNHFPVRWYYSEDLNDDGRRTHFLALLSDAWAVDFWVIVSYYLYKIKYFFTV